LLFAESVIPSVVLPKHHHSLEDGRHLFEARSAYAQFMAAFFPGPNLLLEDGAAHEAHKAKWRNFLLVLPQDSISLISALTNSRLLSVSRYDDGKRCSEAEIDLYEVLKSLAWDTPFGVFLDLHRSQSSQANEFARMEHLQELLLHGQFSLFPVS